VFIKKEGSAIISSIIVLFLMSLLGFIYYRMSVYNIELEALNYNHSDRYKMSTEENETIYKFMEEINKNVGGKLSDEEEFNVEELIVKTDLHDDKNNILKYNVSTHRFILKYREKNNSEKYRDIDYKIDNKKIILIPLYIFEEKDVKFDK